MSPTSPGQLRAVPHMAPCRQRRGARGSRHPNTHVCTCQSHGCRSRHTVSALLHPGWLTDAQSQCPGGPGLPQARGRHVPLGVLAYDQAPGAGPYWCGTGPSHLGPAGGGRVGGRAEALLQFRRQDSACARSCARLSESTHAAEPGVRKAGTCGLALATLLQVGRLCPLLRATEGRALRSCDSGPFDHRALDGNLWAWL